jgi:hypothetical protein
MPLSIHQSIVVTALSCAVGLSLLSGTARAQSETFQESSYLGAANSSAHYKLPAFNTDLGTLEDVNITLQFNLCPVITVDNTTGAPAPFTATQTLPITADLPGGLDSVTPVSGTRSGTGKAGDTTFYLPRSINFVTETVAPADLTDWETALNQKLTLVVSPGVTTTAGTSASGVTFTGTSTEWAQVTVTYVYSAAAAAPEPSGRILSFIVGAVMLAGFISRTRIRSLAA